MPDSTIALYPGTFDPITNGHVDLIKRALTTFDRIIVLVAHSRKKQPLFSAEDRKKMIEQCFPGNSNVQVDIHSGLLVDYAQKQKVKNLLRGLRAVADFEYEFQMATMNRRMYPELQTYLLMASEKYFFINSTVVKEVAAHGGDVSEMVPAHVDEQIRSKFT